MASQKSGGQTSLPSSGAWVRPLGLLDTYTVNDHLPLEHMTEAPLTFDLPFLQAISDWQWGSSLERGELLKALCADLPPQFRTAHSMCFRKLKLKKGSIWDLVAEDLLPEKISSWTMDTDVAKTIKGGVPKEGWQGVVLFRTPPAEQIIVNLWALYRESKFTEALTRHRHDIKDFEKGAGKYWDTQSEVVMEIDSVTQADIYSLGGYSSSFESLVGQAASILHEGCPTAQQIADLEWKAEDLRCEAGQPKWLTYDATTRVLVRIKPRADALVEVKKRQKQEPH